MSDNISANQNQVTDQNFDQIDHRHKKRIRLFQELFACTFSELNTENCLAEKPEDSTIRRIILETKELDAKIQEAAPERPLTEINKVDLAILRLILFESKYKKTPIKVLIDEGIEIAKEFSGENSPGFINGVLAKLLLADNNSTSSNN